MGRARATTSAARRRFLEAADRLFYQHGVRTVGIDRVIAEAGVAKMTLYTHFPSKDDLILAVLQHHERTDLEFFRSTMERHDQKPPHRIEHLVQRALPPARQRPAIFSLRHSGSVDAESEPRSSGDRHLDRTSLNTSNSFGVINR
ncbi:DNA-binding transcriptional repressor AcrR [Gemmata sp. SH-PL17]|uniref:TetR/AcrR family transcriptional regulator n=1 Tax=Gemmata sp. SH-PL17 TaxID=1630693 RepID=UPI00078C2DBA|nr:DNA-binding transcriptional repressor AcrR [Gemmata sp. SH-PL17]